jgi:hypothetical protein
MIPAQYNWAMSNEAAFAVYIDEARHIVPGMVRRDLCIVRRHSVLAGLQLADIVASAFFQAANATATTHDLEPAKILKSRVAREDSKRDAVDFGLTAWPRPSQAPIPKGDRAIFEFYGYRFLEG